MIIYFFESYLYFFLLQFCLNNLYYLIFFFKFLTFLFSLSFFPFSFRFLLSFKFIFNLNFNFIDYVSLKDNFSLIIIIKFNSN